jgi:hypothetical protein
LQQDFIKKRAEISNKPLKTILAIPLNIKLDRKNRVKQMMIFKSPKLCSKVCSKIKVLQASLMTMPR